MDITIRYGNIILVKTIDSSIAMEYWLLKNIFSICGVKIIPSETNRTVRNVTSVNVAFIKSWVIFFCASLSEAEEFVSRSFLKVGMNATETEFSAKSLLKKFGT